MFKKKYYLGQKRQRVGSKLTPKWRLILLDYFENISISFILTKLHVDINACTKFKLIVKQIEASISRAEGGFY